MFLISHKSASVLIRSFLLKNSARTHPISYSSLAVSADGGQASKESSLQTQGKIPYWNWMGLQRGTRRKAAHHPEVDIRAPKEDISEFELKVYKAHFLSIPAIGTRMKLSGLYMQATCGPNTTGEPSRSFPNEHAHWIAWKSHGDMPKEDAAKEYIDTVASTATCLAFPPLQPYTLYSK